MSVYPTTHRLLLPVSGPFLPSCMSKHRLSLTQILLLENLQLRTMHSVRQYPSLMHVRRPVSPTRTRPPASECPAPSLGPQASVSACCGSSPPLSFWAGKRRQDDDIDRNFESRLQDLLEFALLFDCRMRVSALSWRRAIFSDSARHYTSNRAVSKLQAAWWVVVVRYKIACMWEFFSSPSKG